MSVRDYNATPSSNTTISSIDIAEGCSPSGINNAIRQQMADLKDVSTGAVALESPKFDSILDGNIKATDASGTDTAGTATTIKGGAGTGTGAGGSIIFQVADGAGSTGSSVNAHATAMTITDDGSVDINGNELILDADGDTKIVASTDDVMTFDTAGSEAMRVDASGNLLVGQSSDPFPGVGNTVQGISLHNGGRIAVSSDGNTTAYLNRKTSDGDIIDFRKDGTAVGSIGATSSTYLYIGQGDTGLLFQATANAVEPWNPSSNGPRDNAIDLGLSSNRFDDIYATNGTIQTSDANEKQQIASLTDAEITAAKAISALFKTFKWNDKVEAKGDAARTHTGVIAQDVEAAMTAAGLDAGDYAFFISSDWYVDADGNEVEADAEGAIAKNRKGIRYPELLSFVSAATEQRLADIETRLTALENV